MLLSFLNFKPGAEKDHETINNAEEMQEAFAHFFSKGAPAERYTANAVIFKEAVLATEKLKGVEVI